MTSDQLDYQTRPDSRTIMCNDCPKNWFYGCGECAELFADYHRNEFGHKVVVIPQRPHERNRRPLDSLRVTQRAWWER